MRPSRQIFIAFGMAAAITAGAFYFFVSSRIPINNPSYAEPQVTVIPLNKKEIEEARTKSEREITESEVKKAFENREIIAQQAIERAQGEAGPATLINVPLELLKKDSHIKITPSPSFLLTTSIRSRAGDRIAYGEISDCIGYQNLYDEKEAQKCPDWKYRLFVKDARTGVSSLLYSFPEHVSYLENLFVPRAHAGGCPLPYFPITWSKNDKEIILMSAVPVSCGSSWPSPYRYYSISSQGGPVEKLSTAGSVFMDDYTRVAFPDNNPEGFVLCAGESSGENNGKLILRDIETRHDAVILSDRALFFEPRSASADGKTLSYSIRHVKEIPPQGGCTGEVEEIGPTEELPIYEIALP